MNVLGISAYYHDSAAALVCNGQLVAAAQEERFSRKKHDDRFPAGAVRYCLREAGLELRDLDAVVFYEKPFIKFERLLMTYMDRFPHGFSSFIHAIPVWMKDKLWMKSLIRRELEGYSGSIYFNDHHLSHAASAFLVSPFEEAAIVTVDGVGEWSTSTWGVGRGNRIELMHETRFPHSLGLLYSAYTSYLGFKVNSAEYKVMGLAPYGRPTFYDQVRKTVDWKQDGSFRLKTEYFDYLGGLRMTNERFHRLFGGPPRKPESWLTQRDFDIAASIQKVTDEIMVAMAAHIRRETGMSRLCMAGGVALNCVANARVLAQSGFDEIWVQPAAGDAGGALGAAFHFWNCVHKNPRTFVMETACWGPEYGEAETRAFLDSIGAKYDYHPDGAGLCRAVAERIARGHVVGWHQGRMEFGPRALGSRSILGDPRDAKMKDTINQKIKFREGFRPFAPSVLEEEANDWFDLQYGDPSRPPHPSPFMLLVADARIPEGAAVAAGQELAQAEAQAGSADEGGRAKAPDAPSCYPLPAVTHVDGSARLQTVSSTQSPLYHRLIAEYKRQTGVPVVINTSFNVRGEPIVNTPADAYRCFMRTHMDDLAVGPFLLARNDQPEWKEEGDWRSEFALD